MMNNPMASGGNGATGVNSASQPSSYMGSPLGSPRLLPNSARAMLPGDVQQTASAGPAPFDQCVQKLREFLTEAPRIMSQQPDKPILQYTMENGETISCVRWKGQYYISGTDIVRILLFRFQRANRPVMNTKKFEEGVFSDLRMLKPGSGAVLEEPRSEFLDFLYKHNCIRTQKKQKVFHWYSVAHDQLYWDAMERELKRENSLHNINLFMLNEKRQREMLFAAAAQHSTLTAPFMPMGYGAPNPMLATSTASFPGAYLPSLPTANGLSPSAMMMPGYNNNVHHHHQSNNNNNSGLLNGNGSNNGAPPPPGPQPNGSSGPSMAAQQLSASFGVNPTAVFDSLPQSEATDLRNGIDHDVVHDPDAISAVNNSITSSNDSLETGFGASAGTSAIDSFFLGPHDSSLTLADNLEDPFLTASPSATLHSNHLMDDVVE
jgi:hypothetical protein